MGVNNIMVFLHFVLYFFLPFVVSLCSLYAMYALEKSISVHTSNDNFLHTDNASTPIFLVVLCVFPYTNLITSVLYPLVLVFVYVKYKLCKKVKNV